MYNARMNPNAENYERLGHKTFFMFLLRRMGFLFAYLIGLLALVGVKFYFLPDVPVLNPIIFSGIGLGALIFVGSFFFAWLEYVHYAISLEEGGLKIKRGVLLQEELAIPYRRIQQVKIERNPLDLAVGVSSIIITLLGDADNVQSENLRIILFALDKSFASDIQDRLLKKAQVDKVTVLTPPQTPPPTA